MTKRITAIIGAGASVELNSDGGMMPSTGNITKRLVNKTYYDVLQKTNIDLVKKIYMRLYRKRLIKDKKIKSTDYYSIGNFEKIFHILENLYAFDLGWTKAQNPTIVPPFSSVVKPSINYDANQIRTVLYDYIREIMEIVNEYDSAFNTNTSVNWYKDFWSGLKQNLDVFTFNYDTTIEQSVVDYIDGYVDDGLDYKGTTYQKFVPTTLIDSDEDKTCINHVHGCIMYGRPIYKGSDYDNEDLFKFNSYSDSKNIFDRISSSNSATQAGEEIVMGPIITGLHKTEKTLCLPYDVYAKNLSSKIKLNNRFLIVGYSFGDFYVNKMLERINLLHGKDYRVVLIDYWPSLKDHIKCENNNGNLTITPIMMDHYVENWDDKNNINQNELKFICNVADCNLYQLWNNMSNLSINGPMLSNNGRLMLFLGKFSEAVQNHKKEIYDFLIS